MTMRGTNFANRPQGIPLMFTVWEPEWAADIVASINFRTSWWMLRHPSRKNSSVVALTYYPTRTSVCTFHQPTITQQHRCYPHPPPTSSLFLFKQPSHSNSIAHPLLVLWGSSSQARPCSPTMRVTFMPRILAAQVQQAEDEDRTFPHVTLI